MEKAWRQSVEAIVAELSESDLREVVTRLRVVAQRHETLVVEAPNRLAADVVRERCLPALQRALEQASGGELRKITLTLPSGAQQELFPAPALAAKPTGKAVARRSALLPKYTFANFVVGASNQFAHAASQAVANQPGDHYNPLFIYGGVGLGKTHLVNAIGHRAATKRPALKVLYLSSESFMYELIASLRRDKMDEFKTKFRNIDILILDDVQFIAGKERTQEEFFHTFNSLYDSHKQIVITSDKFPKEIPGLEDRLRNRFEWGLIADIQPPDIETRVAILQKKAETEGFQLPHDVAIFIASNIDSNVRELEGSLTRLGAFASLTKSPVTLELTREVLHNTLKGTRKEVTVESIQRTICEYFEIKLGDLKAKRRTQNIALPRQVAMYLCRKHTDSSYPAIGSMFGGRDHSTVIHASRTIERKIKQDPNMQTTIEKLERNLNIKK